MMCPFDENSFGKFNILYITLRTIVRNLINTSKMDFLEYIATRYAKFFVGILLECFSDFPIYRTVEFL